MQRCISMLQGHEAWTCSMDMKHAHAAWSCSVDMQREQAAWICSIYSICSVYMRCVHIATVWKKGMHHRYAAYAESTSGIDTKRGHAACTCSKGRQQGQAVWTGSIDVQHAHVSVQGRSKCRDFLVFASVSGKIHLISLRTSATAFLYSVPKLSVF
jgi:hypothetical protein